MYEEVGGICDVDDVRDLGPSAMESAPEAGMNVTKYKGDVAKVGFKAGAAVSYTFGSGWFSLQSGLYYVRRGEGTVFL